jgi:hypothetical protein
MEINNTNGERGSLIGGYNQIFIKGYQRISIYKCAACVWYFRSKIDIAWFMMKKMRDAESSRFSDCFR